MAAYKKGNQITPMPSSIGNKIPTIGTTRTIMPSSAASLTSGQSGIGQMQGSFDKMFGGKGGPSSMGLLEAASMRLADAESKRGISEKEAESELMAKLSGYSSLGEMQYDMRKKRQEQEFEEKKQKEDAEMINKGYVKIGGRWTRKSA